MTDVKISDKKRMGKITHRLEELGMTMEDLLDFKYCGKAVYFVDSANTYKREPRVHFPNYYFIQWYPNIDILPYVTFKCICDQDIYNHHFASNSKDVIITIGSCCQHKFLPKDKQNKTCSQCGKPHKNRSDNICLACRTNNKITYCMRCDSIYEINNRKNIYKLCVIGDNTKKHCEECIELIIKEKEEEKILIYKKEKEEKDRQLLIEYKERQKKIRIMAEEEEKKDKLCITCNCILKNKKFKKCYNCNQKEKAIKLCVNCLESEKYRNFDYCYECNEEIIKEPKENIEKKVEEYKDKLFTFGKYEGKFIYKIIVKHGWYLSFLKEKKISKDGLIEYINFWEENRTLFEEKPKDNLLLFKNNIRDNDYENE